MKTLLITGGTGFIGRNLVEQLSGDYTILAPAREELDLCDTEKVERYLHDHQVNIVIHTANSGCRDDKNATPQDTLECGLRMYANLERCNHLYDRMYYFGSGAEYDCRHYIPYMTEDYFGRYVPQDRYGFYKYLLSKQCEQKENIVDLRLFGVYGKYELWATRFISCNICRVLKGMPMTLSQNMYFDYIYIDDLVKIMRWFIEHTPRYKHYNVCRGEHIDLYSLGNVIKKTLQSDCRFIVANTGYKREYSGDNSRLYSETGMLHFRPFEDTIWELAQYYQGILQDINGDILV